MSNIEQTQIAFAGILNQFVPAFLFRERGNYLRRRRANQEVQMDNNHTVLVVDDMPAILTLVRRYLEDAGFSVIAAENGLQGLAAYTRHRSVVKLLLTDVEMPNMTGAEMADRILGENPDLPVLFMSGNDPCADRGWGCVAKPFRGGELLARVRIALETQSALK